MKILNSVAVTTFTILAFISASTHAISEQQLLALTSAVKEMCETPTKSGEKFKIEGTASGGAIIKAIGAKLEGTINKKTWEGIEQIIETQPDRLKCVAQVSGILVPSMQTVEPKNTRQNIESEIQNIIGYKDIADMVCIATPEGGGLDKWEIFKSRITRNIEAIEKIINYPNFRDNVASSIYKHADVSLQEIKGILNIHHNPNTLELVDSLKRVDRLYQVITEVLLYFVGEHSISNGSKFFPKRLYSIKIITKNSYYCDETLYQKPTKQSLNIR